MTKQIIKIWDSINRVLTIINIYLFVIITFSPVSMKKVRERRIPLVANIILLLFLSLTLISAIYAFYARRSAGMDWLAG